MKKIVAFGELLMSLGATGQSRLVQAESFAVRYTGAEANTAVPLAQFGILVNGIARGSILTEGTKQLFYGEGGQFRDSVQKMLDHVPLGRPGTTDEIAVAALFLADPEKSYTNGHILTVDGGWTAGYAREF
jgi:NAD(P)-dependent dehydrogenase (short-subunit alcohol dehydrogenase family)